VFLEAILSSASTPDDCLSSEPLLAEEELGSAALLDSDSELLVDDFSELEGSSIDVANGGDDS
jgi:hypothetical protein